MAWRVVVSPVRDLSRANGIRSAEQLAREANISSRTALKWWKGFTTRYIDGNVLYAICHLLDCTVSDVISGEAVSRKDVAGN